MKNFLNTIAIAFIFLSLLYLMFTIPGFIISCDMVGSHGHTCSISEYMGQQVKFVSQFKW